MKGRSPEFGGPVRSGREKPLKGMILAAGYGRRFRPLTLFFAKPAIPFLNRPLIEYSLELFRSLELQEIMINLHHAPETVEAAVAGYLSGPAGEWRPEVSYSREETILGTAGGIGKVRDWLDDADLIVSNGKIFLEQDLVGALKEHRRRRSCVTLLLRPFTPDSPYNPVLADGEGNVRGFCLKSALQSYENAYVFTGVQVISNSVLELIGEGYSDTVKEVYPELIRRGSPVRGLVVEGPWYECSWPGKYLRNTGELLFRKGLTNLLAEKLEGDLEGVVAGPGVRLGEGCSLRDVVLMQDVVVGSGSSLSDVIISPGLELPSGTVIRNAVVTPTVDPIPDDMAAEVEVVNGRHLIWPLK